MTACKNKNLKGRVHSIETFGTHEGPGIRFVVFLQGCLARCLYCQNPDTWDLKLGNNMTSSEIFRKLKSCLPYITSSKGGITLSGGEPLLQIDFVTKLFCLCKKNRIHTAIDTGAFYYPGDSLKLSRLFKHTDLFIVDIKAVFPELHKRITSMDMDRVFNFIKLLEKKKRPYWLRYVLLPGLNDSKKDTGKIKKILANLKYCRKFEFLPYHTLGKHKWKDMGLKFPLGALPAATSKDIKKAEKALLNRG